MGGEVLDHADVGDPGRERALPPGDDLVDLARARRPRAASAADCSAGLYRSMCPTRADQPALARRPRPACCAAARSVRERLLDQRVDAGLGQREPDLLVVARWARRRRSSRCPTAMSSSTSASTGRPPATPVRGRRPGRRRRRGRRRRAGQHAGVVAAHHPQPDQAGAQVAPCQAARLREGVDRVRRCARGRPASARGAPAARGTRARPARSPAGRRRAGTEAAGGSGSGRRRRDPTLYSSLRARAKPSRSSGTRIVYWW